MSTEQIVEQDIKKSVRFSETDSGERASKRLIKERPGFAFAYSGNDEPEEDEVIDINEGDLEDMENDIEKINS